MNLTTNKFPSCKCSFIEGYKEQIEYKGIRLHQTWSWHVPWRGVSRGGHLGKSLLNSFLEATSAILIVMQSRWLQWAVDHHHTKLTPGPCDHLQGAGSGCHGHNLVSLPAVEVLCIVALPLQSSHLRGCHPLHRLAVLRRDVVIVENCHFFTQNVPVGSDWQDRRTRWRGSS